MKGSITYAQTLVLVLICVLIVAFLIYLIINKNLVPNIINSLEFIINGFQGIPGKE